MGHSSENTENSHEAITIHESSAMGETGYGTSNCTCNMGHNNQSEDHGETEHHEEDEHHTSPHLVVWPSAVGMMVFISLSGYLFFYFYSK